MRQQPLDASTCCAIGWRTAGLPACAMHVPVRLAPAPAHQRWSPFSVLSAPPSRRCRSRLCWTASNARTGSVCIGGPWSESCALVHEKKRRAAVNPRPVRAPASPRGGFHVAGGPAQAEYERRRSAFLGWDSRAGAARPAGLDLAGLAGLLTRPAAEWPVRCVAARPSRWTGTVDTRMTALDEAYRLILRAAPSRGTPVTTQECKEDGHASRTVRPRVDRAPGTAGHGRVATGCAHALGL